MSRRKSKQMALSSVPCCAPCSWKGLYATFDQLFHVEETNEQECVCENEQVWLSRQEDNEEATRCEHYGGGSSNHVALDVAGEEAVSPREVEMVQEDRRVFGLSSWSVEWVSWNGYDRALGTRLSKDVSGCDVMITGSTLDQHVWLSKQEDNEEATRCEHYGGGSSNHVALGVAGEEFLSPGEVWMPCSWKGLYPTFDQLFHVEETNRRKCKNTVECVACLLGRWNGSRGTGSTLDQHVWLSRQEDNEEATRCKHYSGGSSNHVALDVAEEEVVSPGEVGMILELESPVSNEEIRRAVWACGDNKSPGPDGFTFEFFRKFWNIVGPDMCEAVGWFFNHNSFARGCNSSFVSLIPKIQDPKLVSDFRPISLIGSLYKVVTKILAMRLSVVISDLVSEVQTAFLPNRQILDGPFIINELLSWCKLKKQQAMVLKIDFAKAYDSIRWDFLDDVLSSFGFGSKWRSWIKGSLYSGMASILVNGSPTAEFQFHCGLTRRLFIYDAVFIGELSNDNLRGIMQILHCFSLSSGLKINLSKSQLLGVGVDSATVYSAALNIGCSVMKTPFKYLGVMVGGNMATGLKVWNETILKALSSCSIEWKINTLSIGGRLTLLKSVLGSTPIYSKSLYKVPKSILNLLESLRRNFFNGVQGDERKISMRVKLVEDEFFLPKEEVATRWIKSIPIKVNVFAWKLHLDRLPTRLNLVNGGVHVLSTLCPICGVAHEDASHIFFSCEVAMDVSRLICRWWNIFWTHVGSYSEWLSWLKSLRLGSKIKGLLEGVFYVLWWSLWNFRNHLLFTDKSPRRDVLFDDIVSRSFNWCSARCKNLFSWDSWLQHPYLIPL
ncbi:RNA-directed DNA polymerase, eukaryota [Tanacetum coccineum]